MPGTVASLDAIRALFAASEVSQPKDAIGFLMWQVTHAWQRHVEELLEPCGLTHLQFVILISTAWHMHRAEPPSQAVLARWTRIHPMQVSQVVKLLLTKKLLIRDKKPGDGRAHLLALTREGIERMSIAVPLVHQAQHVFFGTGGGTEEALKTLLARLFENLAPATPFPAQVRDKS
jgi:DNA-binding MarR family transcriptional regulator